MQFPPELPIPESVLEIARTLEDAGFEAWCVGGAVRDALLGGAQEDFDLATSATPEETLKLFPRRTVPVGLRFGTVAVLDRDRHPHEVTTFRHDVETDGRHAVVRYGASLKEDLARRDFTVNAIAYHPLRREWRDPFGGAADLTAGIIRAVGDPAQRFREDYLRVLRALRFAARLDFVIETATWTAAGEAAAGLAGLSAERVREEWFKGLRTASQIERLVALWVESGAAAVVLPELLAAPPVPGAGALAPRDPVRLTAALTGSAAPTVLRRLKASNDEIGRAEAIVRGPVAPLGSDEVAARRWLAAVGPAADDLLALQVLLHGGEPAWTATVHAVRRRGDPTTRAALAVNGADLLRLGLPTGPKIGEVLDRLLDLVLERPELNTPEALLALAKELR